MASPRAETINVRSKLFRPLRDYPAILTQAILLRLSTARGTYWDDPEYGLDLTQFVNDHLTQVKLVGLSTDIKTEVEKDERIATARVTLAVSTTSAGTQIEAAIQVEPDEGDTFELTLAVTDLTVELLTKGA